MRTSLILIVICGCAPIKSIPDAYKISDTFIVSVKQNTSSVALSFSSRVKDGVMLTSKNDSRESNAEYASFTHSQSSTLWRMLREYSELKFQKTDDLSDKKLSVNLVDYWVEYYSPDSAGSQAFSAIFGGEIQIKVIAHVDVDLIAEINGEIIKKRITVSAGNTDVIGIGTGTSTSNMHGGTQSAEFKISHATNEANNKLLIHIDKFIDSNKF